MASSLTMSSPDLANVYRSYIEAILSHDIESMSRYVSDEVVHNGQLLGLEGYKDLLKRNIVDTGTTIEIKRLITDHDHVAALLVFTTKEQTRELVAVKLDGNPFSYSENVFYDFKDDKIIEVHSLVDLDMIRSHRLQ